jgi:NhaP-type Na+/H+ or K+/H+ antiporter
MESAVISRLISASLALALFGVGYNALVAHLARRGYEAGYLAFLVALGALVILAAAAFVVAPLGSAALATVAVCALLFAAAGLPMIVGSIQRHVTARERDRQALADEARRRAGDEP